MSALTSIFYDPSNDTIFITGFAPFPAKTLTAAISDDGMRINVTDFAGYKLWISVPYERISAQDGSVFSTIEEVLAYCNEQFSLTVLVNNGPSDVIEYVASQSGAQTVTLSNEANYILVCINGLIQLTGGITYSYPTVVLSGDLNVDIGDAVTVIVF